VQLEGDTGVHCLNNTYSRGYTDPSLDTLSAFLLTLKQFVIKYNKEMNELFEKVSPIFQKFRNEPHIEIELRLGKINRGTFDTNVQKETFERVFRGLRGYQGWEQVLETSDTAYYNDNIRLTIDDNTDESKQVCKVKMYKYDHSIQGAPLDVRFCIAKETPMDQTDMEFTKACHRIRTSFVRKNLSIDMTIVSGNPADPDCEDELSYQIELEIVDPQLVQTDNTLFNILHKVHDLMKLLKK
jgi:mRNA capping enzyme, beta chain